jgi:hypothetical protein
MFFSIIDSGHPIISNTEIKLLQANRYSSILAPILGSCLVIAVAQFSNLIHKKAKHW